MKKLQVRLKSASEADFKVTLKEDNSADLTAEYTFYGSDHLFFSDIFARATPQIRQQILESRASEISLGAKITGSSVEFNSYPGKLILHLHIPDFARNSGKFISVPLAGADKFAAAVQSGSARRQTPFLQKNALDLTYRCQITVPEKYLLHAPLKYSEKSEYGICSFEITSRRKKIYVNGRLKLFPGMVPPEKYDFHAGIDRFFSSAKNRYILLNTGEKQ